MESTPLRKTLIVLSVVAGCLYVALGVFGIFWTGHWDDASTSDQVVWVALLLAGGVALLAGSRLIDRSPWAGAALISLGAVVGAMPIFWALLPLVLALVLIVLSVVYARRRTASPA